MSSFENPDSIVVIETAKALVECNQVDFNYKKEGLAEEEVRFIEMAVQFKQIFLELDKSIRKLIPIGTNLPNICFIDDQSLHFISDNIDTEDEFDAAEASYNVSEGIIFINQDRLLNRFQNGKFDWDTLHSIIGSVAEMLLNHYSIRISKSQDNFSVHQFMDIREIDEETYKGISEKFFQKKDAMFLQSLALDVNSVFPQTVNLELLKPEFYFKSCIFESFAITLVLNHFYKNSKLAREGSNYANDLIDMHYALRFEYEIFNQRSEFISNQDLTLFLKNNNITLDMLLEPRKNKASLLKARSKNKALEWVFKFPFLERVNLKDYLAFINLKLKNKVMLGAVNYGTGMIDES